MQQYTSSHFDTAVTSVSALVPENSSTDDIIQRSLQAARKHLNLEVAYLSEIAGDESVFRRVDAPGLEELIKVGDRRSLNDVYCRHILEGRLPELIPDTVAEPLAATMPITSNVPIGSHVSVPVRLGNGELYGMFCCLGPSADHTLNERDLNVMRCFADMAAMEVEKSQKVQAAHELRRHQIAIILSEGLHDIVYQPIWDTVTKRAVGFEALSRFRTEEVRPPDHWFSEAQSVGLGTQLELLAITKALEGLERLPSDSYLTINCSPMTAASSELRAALSKSSHDRLVVELTEHEKIEDAVSLARSLEPLRSSGVRIAIDDAGSGYSGLQQILELEPDIIKLDRSFVRSIGTDPSRQAMAAALANFSQSVKCSIIAEGVETQEELSALEELGFHHIQGYLLGRPSSIDDLKRKAWVSN